MHNLRFLWYLLKIVKVVLVNGIVISLIWSKLETSDLLKIIVFWKKVYDLIISVYDAINNILPGDSNSIVKVAVGPKFSNCSIAWEKL